MNSAAFCLTNLPGGEGEETVLDAPIWMLVVMFSVLPLTHTGTRFLPRRGSNLNCRVCGYDLPCDTEPMPGMRYAPV